MYKKYSIRTLSELYELIRKSEMAGELTTKWIIVNKVDRKR